MVYYDNIMGKRNTNRSGFTIVELLIVVVVIAILAAISIVSYTNIQGRANDAAVQNDLKNIGQKILLWKIDAGRLPVSSGDFTPMGLKVSSGSYGNHYTPASSGGYNAAYCFDTSTQTFAIVAASKSGNVWVFKDGSVKQGVGPLVTVTTTCSNNGQPSTDYPAWFFSNGSWQSYFGD